MDSVTPTLSGFSVALILSAISLMEFRENWTEMTDEEWDELEARIAEVNSELFL